MSVGDRFDGWPPTHGPNGSPVVSIVESVEREVPEYPSEPEYIVHRLEVLCADGSRSKAAGDGKTAGKWLEMSEARSYVLAKERGRNWGQPEFGERFDALFDVLEERLK